MADKDYAAELTAYIDGELSELEAREVRAALDGDPVLRALEAKLRRVVGAVETLPSREASPALRRQVLAAIEAPTMKERLWAWLTGPGLVPTAAAVAATAAAVVLWPKSGGPDDGPGDGEQLVLAQNLELVEDLDVLGLDSADDLDVIASLHELEVQR